MSESEITAAPTPPATAPNRSRRRLLWAATAVVAVIGLAAAGVVALTSGRTGDSIVAKVQCRPADLAGCLIKAPAGAVRLDSSSTWSQRTTPTAALYAANITKDAAGISADTADLLEADGLHGIAHTGWNAVDGNNVDLVVLKFDSQKGAQAWNSVRTAEILAAYPGQQVAIPADPGSTAHAAAKADPQGDIDAAYSAAAGNLVLNVAYSSPKTLGVQDLQTWAGTELASLRTAPAAADPPDAAPGTEKIACGARLRSCLAPMPSGGERWTGSTGKDWVSGPTLTQSQYIRYGWSDKAGTQARVSANFSAAGVTGIAHEDWATDGASKQADIYLVQTITAVGAGQLSGQNFGEPEWDKGVHGISHTIPGEPGARAWYTKKDADGFVPFYFTAAIGNVIVSAWLYFHGSLDTHTADRWAKSELDLVNRNTHAQPMGLFPLAAGKLPAARQGGCPASGDCLVPLPAGASDTTAKSYYVEKKLDALPYTTRYETAVSSDLAVWMGSDGFKGAEHRSWTAANGAEADAVLLKYGKPAQAKAAALLEYGANAPAERVCTNPAVPGSVCLAAAVGTSDPLQKETIWVLAWKGDYEVSVSLTLSNSADVTDAYSWVQRQLDLLPAN
jgi:hypothetical protein